MAYHAVVTSSRGTGQIIQAYNLSEETLRERFLNPYDRGTGITWSGETIAVADLEVLRVFKTDEEVDPKGPKSWSAVVNTGTEVTNDLVTGPPGGEAVTVQSAASSAHGASPLRDARRVMVVHGRNLAARDAMFTFLRALGLLPIEWEEAIAETGTATPHNLDAVRAAMDLGQAVVVVLTAEDHAGLLPSLASTPEDDEDLPLRGQPRQNVILEAGLAMGVDRDRTILVELGRIRRASDFEGLNTTRLTNSAPTRLSLRDRLANAGCAVSERGSDWTRPATGGDFEACVIPWSEVEIPS